MLKMLEILEDAFLRSFFEILNFVPKDERRREKHIKRKRKKGRQRR